MFNTFDIRLALECVKKICDNNRCTGCDKAGGQFKRHSCGHTTCDVCDSLAGYCILCLTPPGITTSNNSSIDEHKTQRASNALELLNVFEKAFNVNVYKHQKMAEHLKLEKDLFPECIQAPNKYFNKRRSYNIPDKKKENRLSKLPGEIIYSAEKNRMANSIYSVEQWFNKNKENDINKNNNKNENDESGIVIDSSSIDCSQTTEDKDKQALLAVYEADKKEQMSDSLLTMESSEWKDNDIISDCPKMLKDEYKVPFYKKCNITETNALFYSDTSILNISTSTFGETKNIQIMIPNNDKCLQRNIFFQRFTSTRTIPVQTEICSISHIKDNHDLKGNDFEESCENTTNSSNHNISQDIFTPKEPLNNFNDANTSNIGVKLATKSIIIEESDSEDGSVTEAEILEVSAQVHRFEHPVLSDITYIDSHEESIIRQNRRRRRLTPDSSNSSEKENFNPNRQKRHKHGKKIKK